MEASQVWVEPILAVVHPHDGYSSVLFDLQAVILRRVAHKVMIPIF